MADPSGRILHINAGDMMSPACCAICGSVGSEDGYADPAIYVEWHGNIYFCKNCSIEISMHWGSVPVEEAERITREWAKLQVLCLEQQALIAAWEPLVELVRGLSNNDSYTVSNAVNAILGEPETIVGSNGNVGENDSQVGGSADGEGSVSPEPVESITNDGPDDVNESASSDIDELISSL